MVKQSVNVQGILTDVRKRNSGSMQDATGREITWNEADILYLLPYGATSGNIQKYTINPKSAKDIYSKTADVIWGAYVQILLDNNQVVDIDVVNDSFSGNLAL